MKLKQRDKQIISSKIIKIIHKKKIKILIICLFILFILFIGSLLGILFIGTLNYSSQDVRNEFGKIGISDELHDLEDILKGIIHENYKIPLDFIKNQFIKTDKIYIDIDFEDYQRIIYIRQNALEKGALTSEDNEYVPATLTHNNEEYKIEIRLKGDWPDHWNGKKWSYRIKVKKDKKFLGMQVFSIQDPKTRNGINEYIYHAVLKSQNLIGLRYKFFEVIINGEKKGIYALEEHFSKELIESNNLKEGPIMTLNEDRLFIESLKKDGKEINDTFLFSTSAIEVYSADDFLEDETLKKELNEGVNLLNALKKGILPPHKVLDTEKFAKYYAIGTILNCPHSDRWHNTKFYYNPISSLIEPIGFDGQCEIGKGNSLENYLPTRIISPNESFKEYTKLKEDLPRIILSDEIIFKQYIKHLENYSSQKPFNLINQNFKNDLEKNIRTIKKDNPFYYFEDQELINSVEMIKNSLNEKLALNAYLEEILSNKVILKVESTSKFPLDIVSLKINKQVLIPKDIIILQPKKETSSNSLISFNLNQETNKSEIKEFTLDYKILGLEETNSREVYLWKKPNENFVSNSLLKQESQIYNKTFLTINEQEKTITINQKYVEITSNLLIPPEYTFIIPPETTINLLNSSSIISYSNFIFNGTKDNEIVITSTDQTGQGITNIKSDRNIISYTTFQNLSNPIKYNWQLPGAINFYETQVIFNNCSFENLQSEDSLNLVRTTFEMRNTTFKNCQSDCFDNDFGKGKILNSKFHDCGNDCIDFSGSNISINNLQMTNPKDKGISCGEETTLSGSNVLITGNSTFINVASKDKSFISLSNLQINGGYYGFASYQKKQEYGPAEIEITNLTMQDVKKGYMVEKGSNLIIDNFIQINKEKNAYEKLYGK